MIYNIERLDIMIAYACNISCKGCISLSDMPRKGVIKYDDLYTDIQYWSKYINPIVVTLFGGEPTLHPQLSQICFTIREYWPNAIIRLITNGYLLNKHDSKLWFELGRVELQISIHRKDHEKLINANILKILQNKKGWKTYKNPVGEIKDHEQTSWVLGDVKIYKSIFAEFIEPYKLENDTIVPHYSDPIQAHAICGSPATPILYKGKLYKCPPVANIMDITGKNWLDYKSCDNVESLPKFVESIGSPEPVCAGCPSIDKAVIVNHLLKENVNVKNLD